MPKTYNKSPEAKSRVSTLCLRPKLRRDWAHENESKKFGIFKEISGFLGSSLGICTKLQYAVYDLA